MTPKIESKNILRGIEKLVFPSTYDIKLMDMPLIDHDYSEFISTEYDMIIKKIDDLYFSAQYPEDIEYLFTRYFQRIKRLLKELDDRTYSLIVDEIIQPAPNNLSETLFINKYHLCQAIYSLYKIFKRDYSDVIELEEEVELKTKFFPYYSFKDIHEDFLTIYSADKDIIELGDFKIKLTTELKDKIERLISEKDESTNAIRGQYFSESVIDNFNFTFRDKYSTYFKELDTHFRYNTSNTEREFICVALEFIQKRIEIKELFFKNDFLDFCLFMVHTNIGGLHTLDMVFEYFSNPECNIEESKLFISKLNDLKTSKLYFKFNLQNIKEIKFPLKDLAIDTLKELDTTVTENIEPLTPKISLANFAIIISLLHNMKFFENTQKEVGNTFASILYSSNKKIAGASSFIANMRSTSASQMEFLETFNKELQVEIDKKIK